MTALAKPDLDRLVKLLGLLASEHVGERAAAALKVVEFVRDRGLEWSELLRPEPERNPVVAVEVGGAAPDFGGGWGRRYAAAATQAYGNYSGLGAYQQNYQPPPPVRRWQDAAMEIMANRITNPAFTVTVKETDFVRDILARGYPTLTAKQADWLRAICAKYSVEPW